MLPERDGLPLPAVTERRLFARASSDGVTSHRSVLPAPSAFAKIAIELLPRYEGRAMVAEPGRKRRMPRFSMRTLAVLLTNICLYFACWLPTTTTGVRDVGNRLASESYYSADGNQYRATPKAPLVLAWCGEQVRVSFPAQVIRRTSYYFWFFGWVARIPFTIQETRVLNGPPGVSPSGFSIPADHGDIELARTRGTS